MCKKLISLISLVLLLGLSSSAFAATYPGQMGVGISLPERGGTMVNQVHEHYRWYKAGGADLTSGDVDTSGWPECDCRYVKDWRPVEEWAGSIDDPDAYRVDMSGLYKCSFNGQATLSNLEGDYTISNQVFDEPSNTTTFDITVSAPGPHHGLIVLDFINTKRTPASGTGTGITNFKMTRPGYLHDTTQLFTDDFINCLTSASFSTIRFMDFRHTNNSEPTYPATTSWSQRKLTTDAGQGQIAPLGKLDGAAWEYVIDLGNQVNMDIWINIQISADTDYVTQLATLIKNNLNSNLNVYVESSNEVWNGIFNQYNYNNAQATALGIGEHENHARRTVELSQIFANVFGSAAINDRVRVMLCSHAPMVKWWVQPMLEYINNNIGPPSDYIYAIARQTYFSTDGSYGTVDEILDRCHDDATNQKSETGGDESGRLQWVQKASDWALVGGASSYEGGFHVPAGGGTTNLDNQITMHRVARAGTELKYNYDDCFFALGGNLAMQFTLTSGYNRYGCWGLTDDVTNPDRNYKFQAIRDILGDVPGPPGQASNPSPADGATDVSTTATLSWTAGSGATSHDVYFGTVTEPPFIGNQTETTYEPGTMAEVTTYYWRIDEVNANGTTTGVAWSFTTAAPQPPGQATNPSPADGATGVSVDADLSWTAGSGADSHDVYFGTASPGDFQGNQPGTTFDPGTLEYDTTYYWRIDEVNANGTTTGVVWSFTTESAPQPPGQATNPSPADGATGVNRNTVILSWTAGTGATSHDVYFGTNPTPGAGEFQGNQTPTTFDPDRLAKATWYYWRIDEVNASGTTTGVVWSFKTK